MTLCYSRGAQSSYMHVLVTKEAINDSGCIKNKTMSIVGKINLHKPKVSVS